MFKRFVLKTLVFFLPLMLLALPSVLFYTKKQGDLIRMGYLPKNSQYRELLAKHKCDSIAYRYIADTLPTDTSKTQVLVIGDSFSGLGECSFTNYLASNSNMQVYLFKRSPIAHNPFQILFGVCNSNILSEKNINVVIIESIERQFVSRFTSLDKKSNITLNDQQLAIAENNSENNSEKNEDAFPSPAFWKFPLYSMLYHFDDHAFFSDVYKIKTSSDALFSIPNRNDALIFNEDLQKVSLNNSIKAIKDLNRELDSLNIELQKRNIHLIVLPCPDKYDLYYPFFSEQNKYEKPIFFDVLDTLPKKYTLVKSKKILQGKLNSDKDLYYYDDTHWTPKTAQFMASELSRLIHEHKH